MLDAGSSVMAEARSLRIIVSQSVVSNQRLRQRNADIEIILICANYFILKILYIDRKRRYVKLQEF